MSFLLKHLNQISKLLKYEIKINFNKNNNKKIINFEWIHISFTPLPIPTISTSAFWIQKNVHTKNIFSSPPNSKNFPINRSILTNLDSLQGFYGSQSLTKINFITHMTTELQPAEFSTLILKRS